jgi:hypothetical protein
MKPLPAAELRSNLATWAVPVPQLPAVGNWMHDALPNESYDPHFRGQVVETTYFDTPAFDLRKARLAKGRYLTLRVRCYQNGQGETYSLSVKTESEKWRQEITPGTAHGIVRGTVGLASLLPGHLAARLPELGAGDDLTPVVTVCCRRYAVEDDTDRFTLDVEVRTDLGKRLPFGVLEYKTNTPGPADWPALPPLLPIKLSKFLWATKP